MNLINKFYEEIKFMERAEICEKIAEDFAIEFSTWISVNYYSIGEEKWLSWNNGKDILASKELLKIYKKEKNL